MAASDIVVRPLQVDERADWEPLWKGYQAFYLKNNFLALLTFWL